MQVVNIMNLDYLPDVGTRLAEQVTSYHIVLLSLLLVQVGVLIIYNIKAGDGQDRVHPPVLQQNLSRSRGATCVAACSTGKHLICPHQECNRRPTHQCSCSLS